jgi:hypothetical protein
METNRIVIRIGKFFPKVKSKTEKLETSAAKDNNKGI